MFSLLVSMKLTGQKLSGLGEIPGSTARNNKKGPDDITKVSDGVVRVAALKWQWVTFLEERWEIDKTCFGVEF